MEYCVLLESADMETAFEELGIGELKLRANTTSKELPFCISPVSEETASKISATFGICGDQYDSESKTLAMQYETTRRLIAAVLGANAYNLGELKMLDGEQLLVRFQPRTFTEKRDVKYCGMVKNTETGQYDVLYVTEASAILAVTRAREHAVQANEHGEKRKALERGASYYAEAALDAGGSTAETPPYDLNDILVQQQACISVQACGRWGRISAESEQALRAFVERNGDTMPNLEEHESEGDA